MIRFLGMLLALIMCLTGCFAEHADETKPLVINVLDKTLYEDCHIPGSVQVDFDKVENYVRTYTKDHPIIVYCSNYACMTSHFVAKKLIEKGYTQVHVYAGGMTSWYLAEYPIVGPAQQPYLHKEIVPDQEISQELPKISTEELAELLKIV